MITRQKPAATGIDCHCLTDPGRVRETNSDACLAMPLEPFGLRGRRRLVSGHGLYRPMYLLAVADGVGRDAGRAASALAVDVASRYVYEQLHDFDHDQVDAGRGVIEILESAVLACQARLQARSAAGDLPPGCGTTLTLACLAWPRLCLTHVGDSRCYLLRDGRFKRLTTDHTFAQRLIDAGLLDAESAALSQWRHVLWNVVGGGTPAIELESRQVRLLDSDVVLLCTDGIPNALPDTDIARLLIGQPDAQEACRDLIQAANQAGGLDNATAIVMRFTDTAPADDE